MYNIDFPSFFLEKFLWKCGKIVVGLDEVGRGALAGPVYVGAYAFPLNYSQEFFPKNIEINDSKKLTFLQRKKAALYLKRIALSYAVASSSVNEINSFGINKAIFRAARRALFILCKELCCAKNVFVITDYFHIPYLKNIGARSQKNIKKGDEKCYSIAAASIIAKVERDHYMEKLGRKYLCYDWQRNKGYGTRGHVLALQLKGVSKHHRKLYVKNFL